MTDDISQRLAQLEAAEATRRLASHYGHVADNNDIDAMAALFTDDAVLATRDGRWSGRDAILGHYVETFSTMDFHKRHFICNLGVTSTGTNTTHATGRFIYTFAGADASRIGWGTYDFDVVIETDGAARFTEMRVDVDLDVDSRVGWATVVEAHDWAT